MSEEAHNVDDHELAVQRILEENDFPSLSLAYDEARRRIDNQFAQIDTLDVKASIFIAATGVIISLTLTTMPIFLNRNDLFAILGVGGIVISAAISTLCSLYALWIRAYFDVPSIEIMISKYIRWQEMNSKYQILFEWRDAHNANPLC